MRLTAEQASIIRQAGLKVLGQLFGSRARDDLKGGDIDLYFETNNVIDNRAQAICKLQGAHMSTLGDRKIDILLKDVRTPESTLLKIARGNRSDAMSLAYLPEHAENAGWRWNWPSERPLTSPTRVARSTLSQLICRGLKRSAARRPVRKAFINRFAEVLDLDGIPVRTINLEGLLQTKQTMRARTSQTG